MIEYKKQTKKELVKYCKDNNIEIKSSYKKSKLIELIQKFNQLSNVPILLNTSFNENEPIVMSPKHAIDCFLRTDMDALILNNFMIKR